MTKKEAREALYDAAFEEWGKGLERARRLKSYIFAEDADCRLSETLLAIESWLGAVYDQGHSPGKADEHFFGDLDRVKGLGHRTPSQVLKLEVSR